MLIIALTMWIVSSDNKQDCNNCVSILEELENIDDDTDRHGIHFLKTQVP